MTWTFVSHIANGGVAVSTTSHSDHVWKPCSTLFDSQLPNNGETPVWEPFLMQYNGQLVCYYSDQVSPCTARSRSIDLV